MIEFKKSDMNHMPTQGEWDHMHCMDAQMRRIATALERIAALLEMMIKPKFKNEEPENP